MTAQAQTSVFVLPVQAQFVGNLTYQGDVELSCSFDGTIRCRKLYIVPGARFVGVIVAELADLRGEVDAEIYADHVCFRSGCSVVGEAYHSKLTLEQGSVFEGKSRRHPNPRSIAPDDAEAHHSQAGEAAAGARPVPA